MTDIPKTTQAPPLNWKDRGDAMTAQCSDALALLRALPDGSAAAAFFDPQHRARQKGRHDLSAMTDAYIDSCCNEIARVLQPKEYSFLWVDTFRLCRGDHLRIKDTLPCVDLIAWDSGRAGMGYRTRQRGDYLLVLQKPPLRARETWKDHGIPSRWIEKVDRRIHPHIKPAGLLRRLIAAVTMPDDLVIDPAAGSFIVMTLTQELGRRFAGCDLIVPPQSVFDAVRTAAFASNPAASRNSAIAQKPLVQPDESQLPFQF